MLIENSVRSATALNRSSNVAGNRQDSTTAFGSALSKAEETKENTKTSNSGSTTQELLKKLNEYIEKGPIVAMREKILKSMRLTEEELQALPPEKQKAVEAEIAQKIKEMLLRQQETAKGQPATEAKASVYAALNGL